MTILKRLREKKKLSKDVEALISNLTIEELVQLKLEIAAKSLGGEPYGFKIWSRLPMMIKKGVYAFASEHFETQASAAKFLGMSYDNWKEIKKDSNYNEKES